MPIILSPNMNLPVPIVGQEAGPQYATDINSCMAILDSHTHSPGSGVQITPDGLNINANLPISGNNLTGVRSVNFNAASGPFPGAPPDLGALYVAGVDLYYNDESGNQIQITANGGVAGANGSIANLTPPASASYVSGTGTFVWQSNANTGANMDNASVTIREPVANANGITIQSPTSLAADYDITLLPALPGSNQPLSINSSGQLSAAQIVTSQIADSQVTKSKLAPLGQVVTHGSGSGISFATSPVSLGSVTITASGTRPVFVTAFADFVASNQSFIETSNSDATVIIKKDGSTVVLINFGDSTSGVTTHTPAANFCYYDFSPSAGSHTYEFFAQSDTSSGNALNIGLVAYEL